MLKQITITVVSACMIATSNGANMPEEHGDVVMIATETSLELDGEDP